MSFSGSPSSFRKTSVRSFIDDNEKILEALEFAPEDEYYYEYSDDGKEKAKEEEPPKKEDGYAAMYKRSHGEDAAPNVSPRSETGLDGVSFSGSVLSAGRSSKSGSHASGLLSAGHSQKSGNTGGTASEARSSKSGNTGGALSEGRSHTSGGAASEARSQKSGGAASEERSNRSGSVGGAASQGHSQKSGNAAEAASEARSSKSGGVGETASEGRSRGKGKEGGISLNIEYKSQYSSAYSSHVRASDPEESESPRSKLCSGSPRGSEPGKHETGSGKSGGKIEGESSGEKKAELSGYEKDFGSWIKLKPKKSPSQNSKGGSAAKQSSGGYSMEGGLKSPKSMSSSPAQRHADFESPKSGSLVRSSENKQQSGHNPKHSSSPEKDRARALDTDSVIHKDESCDSHDPDSHPSKKELSEGKGLRASSVSKHSEYGAREKAPSDHRSSRASSVAKGSSKHSDYGLVDQRDSRSSASKKHSDAHALQKESSDHRRSRTSSVTKGSSKHSDSGARNTGSSRSKGKRASSVTRQSTAYSGSGALEQEARGAKASRVSSVAKASKHSVSDARKNESRTKKSRHGDESSASLLTSSSQREKRSLSSKQVDYESSGSIDSVSSSLEPGSPKPVAKDGSHRQSDSDLRRSAPAGGKTFYSLSKSRKDRTPKSPSQRIAFARHTTISESYKVFLDNQRKLVAVRWAHNDEVRRQEDSHMDDYEILGGQLRKPYRMTGIKRKHVEVYSPPKEIEKEFEKFKARLPPDPSPEFLKQLEIPALERLFTPSRVTHEQPRKAIKINPADFSRFVQAQTDSNKRRRSHGEQDKAQEEPKPPAPISEEVFERLNTISRPEPPPPAEPKPEPTSNAKWTGDETWWLPKAFPPPPEPVDTAEFRELRFNAKSQELTKDSPSLLERSHKDFKEMLDEHRREASEQRQRAEFNAQRD